MTTEKVQELFTMYVGNEDLGEEYSALIEPAMAQVRERMREDADEEDERWDYMAAAIAFCGFTAVTAGRERVIVTAAGGAGQRGDSEGKMAMAKEMERECERACRGMMKDEGFVFAEC